MAMTTANKISWTLGTIVSLATIGSIWYWVQKDKKKAEEDIEEMEGAFYSADETKGSNINTREALRRAGNIYTAMKGMGTDEDAIIRAQHQVNADGLRFLYNTFGIRRGLNMGQWYLTELSGQDLKIVRAQWTNRGVTPPF